MPGTSPGMTNGESARLFRNEPLRLPSIIQLDLGLGDHRAPFGDLGLQEGG